MLAVVVASVGAFYLLTNGQQPGSPYGPDSTEPGGAKALAILLGRLGVAVDTSGALPVAGEGVALVLDDQLDDATRAQVTAWVRGGGSLVVADPASPLAATVVAQGGPNQALASSGRLRPACSAPWAQRVGTIDPAGDHLLEIPPGGYPCFAQSGGAFAVATQEGAGVVVTLGGADPFSNAYLDHDDNALLAANLLAPAGAAPAGEAGFGQGTAAGVGVADHYMVAWLMAPRVGRGTKTLWSLVSGRLKAFLCTLAAAALAVCVWRARRLGRPVREEPLVPVPGSELVLATGRLLARNNRHEEAAAILREDLLARLRSR
ncbi:MAG TPA: DUF4350 domain-containing protein, partial [Acidimicrobiales bacterium]|nr:DUF4350 domain-containing protein [Acidimicrobiales bacterium]